MPNGKPGDHPITDITIHRRRVFSQEIDEVIHAIHHAGRRADLDSLVDWFNPPPQVELRRSLEDLWERLR